ncbi:hypothetical protein C8J45_10145 [Sphingomonas sp. PP-CE-3G-477]|jgi:hypothetical protein|nr:hypothetical protein C8J45_10145 [Sphingomonas sp. PP-CE-3G-477]
MKTVILTLVGSILSAAYWWIAFITVYANALFAGERGPAWTPPADSQAISHSITVIVIAVVIYAFLIAAWSTLKRRLFRALS